MRFSPTCRTPGGSYGARPAFTITVLLAFAFGIGANATMFGIVDGLLFRPPAHVRAPNEIVTLVAGTAPTRGLGSGLQLSGVRRDPRARRGLFAGRGCCGR